MFLDLVFIDKAEDLGAVKTLSKELGNDSVIVAKTFHSVAELEALKKELQKQNFTFFTCHVMEKPDANELRTFRNRADFIAVIGGTANANKFAVSTRGIDFLLSPAQAQKPEFDTAIANTAFQNSKPIGIIFSDFLNEKGKGRSMALKNYIFIVKLLKKYRVNALFFSGAGSLNELRSVKNLSAFAELLGFTKQQAERLTERFPEAFVERSFGAKKGL